MKTNLFKTSIVLALGALIAVTPVVGFAKQDDTTNNSNKNNSCLRAYGHLIAPGWIKLHGNASVDISSNCHIPKGILKKIQVNNPPEVDENDTTAPVISSLTVDPSRYQATVSWTTDERSDSTVYVSRTTPVSKTSSSTKVVTRKNMSKDHIVVVSGLEANTTYNLLVESKDASGNLRTSAETSFVTDPARTGDVRAPIITSLVSDAGTSTITVMWDTNENATARVYYGTTSPIVTTASTTTYVENTGLVEDHSLTITGLATSTRYYLVAQSKDALGNTRTSAQFSIVTDSGL